MKRLMKQRSMYYFQRVLTYFRTMKQSKGGKHNNKIISARNSSKFITHRNRNDHSN